MIYRALVLICDLGPATFGAEIRNSIQLNYEAIAILAVQIYTSYFTQTTLTLNKVPS